MHVSLAAEKLFSFFGIPVNNAIFTTWIVMAVLIVMAVMVRRKLSTIPGRFQATLEMVYGYFLDTADNVVGNPKVVREMMPFVMTLFLFILLSNWTGVLPGNSTVGISHAAAASAEEKHHIISFLRPPSTDLNMVLVMAMLAVGYVQYLGMKYVGVKKYLGKFFNFSGPIQFFIGILEFISELTRTLSYTFRLFGNIFAGKVLVTVMFFLTISFVPFVPILPVPFFMLEMFVGAIQAFVFCFLVIVLTSVAVSDSH